MPSDGNSADVMDFADDHLRRIQQFNGKATMGNDQSANHR
jgi:hypothetical protein